MTSHLAPASFLAIMLMGAACARPQKSGEVADICFGNDPKVAVAPGRIGNIPLDAKVDSIRNVCHTARDTAANVYEALDSAIVIGNAQFTVVATTAVIADDAGENHDSVARPEKALGWFVRGAGGLLPGGVSTVATWRELHRAYGRALLQAETAENVIEFCAMPGLWFTIAAPLDVTKNQTVIDDDDAFPLDSRVVQIGVSKPDQKRSSPCP